MATIANLKSKLVLDIGEFSSAADRAVGKAKSMSKGIEDALKKAGKQWRDSVGKGVMALVGAQMADTLVKTIDERMKSPMFDNIGANLAYAIGEGFKTTLETVPIAGTVGNWIGSALGKASDFVGLSNDASGEQEARQQASRQAAELRQNAVNSVGEIVKQLERQKALASAINQAERERLEQQYKLEDLLKQVNAAGLKGGLSPDQIRAQAERVREEFAGVQRANEEARRREEERLANQEFWTQELEKGQEIMDEIEEAWDYIAELGELTAEAQAEAAAQAEKRAKANAEEAMAAARRALEFSNVETIGTAIGGVKIGGMTSNSIERMMPTQEAIKSYSAQIARNTERLAAAGAP
jgi:hypothetical protein